DYHCCSYTTSGAFVF
nr:immunoglobulin light chain junction region [Macaca mulatta]